MSRWLFVPSPAPKPWNGSSIYLEPLGGSEAAVAYTARDLVKLGEGVSVATNGVDKPTKFEGVEYWPINFMETLLQIHWDYVVVSRWLEALNQNWKCKVRIFWIHDMPYIGAGTMIPANVVVGVSQFQLRSWGLSPTWAVEIGNGVDLRDFTSVSGEVVRNPNRLIWTSNFNRGLPVAAKIFQEIRKRWPDMELHVFGGAAVYGWSEDTNVPYLPRKEHMENVILHGPVPRPQLAQELLKSWAFFYPTYYPETFCISALEAQAAGLPVIASPTAALPETVKGGILGYDFINAVSQLRNKRRWDKLSHLGLEWAAECSWAKRAELWFHLAREVEDALHKPG